MLEAGPAITLALRPPCNDLSILIVTPAFMFKCVNRRRGARHGANAGFRLVAEADDKLSHDLLRVDIELGDVPTAAQAAVTELRYFFLKRSRADVSRRRGVGSGSEKLFYMCPHPDPG